MKDPMPNVYQPLHDVLMRALADAFAGKGRTRHALPNEPLHEQPIIRLGEWMGSTHFAVGQACKKAIESTRLDRDAAVRELLGAINYLAAAVIQLERAK